MIFRSPFPPVEIPNLSVSQYVFRNMAQWADKTALIDGISGAGLTYSELRNAIRLTAGGLRARGFGPGAVLAIISSNCPQYTVAFQAAAWLGGATTTANPLYTAAELANQLRDSGAVLVVTMAAFADKVAEAAQGTGIREIFTFDEAAGFTPFSALAQAAPLADPVAVDPAQTVVALPYSSGTTGLPKGVMLTHRNLVANYCQIDGGLPSRAITERETLLGLLPFFHIYGLSVIMNHALSKGATVVTLPRFEMRIFLETLQRYKVTRAHLVPPLVLALAKDPLVDGYDLSALENIHCGAAPLGKALERDAANRVNAVVAQGYGLTETSPVTHTYPPSADYDKPGSIGPSVPNTESMVVDVSTEQPLGPNQQGEIWVRGPQVMKGYLGQPEATRAAITPQGWFRTGDIGLADDDGFFTIVDRLKELIKYNGLQVAPAELEAVLVSHPGVSDAAVIPSPDEQAGEVPKAFVVAERQVSDAELLDYVASRVAPHKKIRLLERVGSIPKSPSGKILRRVLIEQERDRLARR